eukprot:g6246.t1
MQLMRLDVALVETGAATCQLDGVWMPCLALLPASNAVPRRGTSPNLSRIFAKFWTSREVKDPLRGSNARSLCVSILEMAAIQPCRTSILADA